MLGSVVMPANNKPNPHAVEKLPKWAQQQLTRLRADRDFWKKEATLGPGGSNTFIERRGAEESDTPLGRTPKIRFDLKPERRDGHIFVRIANGRLTSREECASSCEPRQPTTYCLNW